LTSIRLVAFSAALLAGAATPAFALVSLTPHRAIYELRLGESRGAGGGVEQARGRIVYEFTGDACSGYALNFRQVTELSDGEGQTNVSDLRSETWEDGAARSFRFSAKNYLNDQLDRDTDGRAEKAGDAVKVTVSKPNQLTKSYEPGTLFPTEHLVKIIEAAHAGRTMLEAPVYDGSEAGDKTFDTFAVIGKPSDAPPEGLEAAARRPELKGETYWPISVSYFERGKKTDGEQTPDYQIGFDLYENGISRDLKIDYGDFTIRGELKELEIMSPGDCRR
jgi:hypothetical protein